VLAHGRVGDRGSQVKQEFEVSVEELLRTLKRRGIPLASEMGAFITLEVCEQIIDRPTQVSTNDVSISEIGEVLCQPKLGLAQPSEADAVHSLLLLLGDLLVCAAPGVPTMLLELVERGPSEQQFTLDRLRDDLEACLLPLNRGATRRVLARLLREARKAGPSQRSGAQPTAADIDAQFDALLGAAAGPTHALAIDDKSEIAATTPRALQVDDKLEIAVTAPRTVLADDKLEIAATTPRANLAEPAAFPRGSRGDVIPSSAIVRPAARRFDEAPITEPLSAAGAVASTGRTGPSIAACSELADALEPEANGPAPEQVRLALMEPSDAEPPPGTRRRSRRQSGFEAHGPDRDSDRRPDLDGLVEGERRSSLGVWAFIACVVAALGLMTGYLVLGRDGARHALGLLPQLNSAPTSPNRSPSPKREVGELHVTSNPPRAQVLLLIGPGPALATDLPVGVAQEFVALADGYAPARAVIPTDAVWEDVAGKPRYELAIQGVRTTLDSTKLGLGKTLLPPDVGTPQARLGSVRVVTTPKGAKVYQLIGFTPDVRVENLPLDQSYEVLVYLEGRAAATRQLSAADFKALDGRRVADIDLALSVAKTH